MSLKVLGRTSSINVRKVLWALDEIGVSYEREDWGTGFRDVRSPDFLALNPNGQVPVINDGGFVLWESNAIMRYLAEGHPDTLLPADRQQMALAEQWLDWQASELNPAWSYAHQALRWRNPDYQDQTMISRSLAAWNQKMGLLDAQLARTGAFAAGARFALADIALGLSTHRWVMTDFDKPSLEHVEAYRQRLLARPAGARYMHRDTP